MRLAVHSASPALGDPAANVQTVAAALADDVDVVVFPEMFLTGYNIGDDVQRLAFADDDPRLAPLREAARSHGTHVIVGAPRQGRVGVTYNSALCIDDEGEVTWVDKRYLPTFATFREGLFFAQGTDQPVWHTRLGGIGVGICYDLYFPELQKQQVLDGADILVNISASPSVSRRFFEALLPARAIENAAFMIYANNVGAQDGIVFWGGGQVIGPRGERRACSEAYAEDVLHAEIDLTDLAAAREFRPTLRDTLGQA